jgi:hypothetical protein
MPYAIILNFSFQLPCALSGLYWVRHFPQGVPRALKLLSGGAALCYYISGFQPFQ